MAVVNNTACAYRIYCHSARLWSRWTNHCAKDVAMRIWIWLIFLVLLVSLAGILACASTRSYEVGNTVIAPLFIVAFGQFFIAVTIRAIREDKPVMARWRRGPFGAFQTRYYSRQGNPFRYWFTVILFISIGSVITVLGIWLLLKGAIVG